MDDQKLPMRDGVGVIVLNHKNEVFVGKRKDNPNDKWQMPQGGLDSGENYITAMKRELFEETSIKNIEVLKEIDGFFEYELPKSLVGVIWQISTASTDTFFSPIYSFVVPIWSTLMLNKWDLFNHKRNYIWNHHNFEISETLRAEFYSDDQKEIEYLGNKIKIKEKQTTILTYLQSYSIYSFFLGLIVANAYLYHYIKNILEQISAV